MLFFLVIHILKFSMIVSDYLLITQINGFRNIPGKFTTKHLPSYKTNSPGSNDSRLYVRDRSAQKDIYNERP